MNPITHIHNKNREEFEELEVSFGEKEARLIEDGTVMEVRFVDKEKVQACLDSSTLKILEGMRDEIWELKERCTECENNEMHETPRNKALDDVLSLLSTAISEIKANQKKQ